MNKDRYEKVTVKALVTVKGKGSPEIVFDTIATQEYSPDFDCGHYQGVIFDMSGNILNVFQSCCGAPQGKIDKAFVEKEAKEFYQRTHKYRNF